MSMTLTDLTRIHLFLVLGAVSILLLLLLLLLWSVRLRSLNMSSHSRDIVHTHIVPSMDMCM